MQQRLAVDTHKDVETVVHALASSVDEVLGLHAREQEWTALLEERAASYQGTIDRMREIIEERQSRLRFLTHDLRNPLCVIGITGTLLKEIRNADPTVVEMASDVEDAVRSLEKLISSLSETMRAENDREMMEPVEIAPLTGRIERQLRALLLGRAIDVKVFQTREAPARIETIGLLFHRVVDNLITNAAKYTERGNITVEVGGAPGQLMIKISDTGRGIAPDRIERVFLAGEADPAPVMGTSSGLGLGIVARLLDGLGGRLELVSEPGIGTTFWVYVPTALPEDKRHSPTTISSEEPLDRIVERVVRVRSTAPPSWS